MYLFKEPQTWPDREEAWPRMVARPTGTAEEGAIWLVNIPMSQESEHFKIFLILKLYILNFY